MWPYLASANIFVCMKLTNTELEIWTSWFRCWLIVSLTADTLTVGSVPDSMLTYLLAFGTSTTLCGISKENPLTPKVWWLFLNGWLQPISAKIRISWKKWIVRVDFADTEMTLSASPTTAVGQKGVSPGQKALFHGIGSLVKEPNKNRAKGTRKWLLPLPMILS